MGGMFCVTFDHSAGRKQKTISRKSHHQINSQLY